MSNFPELTPREIILTSLRGFPDTALPTPENRFVEGFTEQGVDRKQALPIVHELIEQGLVERHAAPELSGELAYYQATVAGSEAKEAIYERRIDQAVEALGMEARHEQVIKAADAGKEASEVIAAWKTLGEEHDLVETVRELVAVELLDEYSLHAVDQRQRGDVQLKIALLGMKMVARNGWSRHAKARKDAEAAATAAAS